MSNREDDKRVAEILGFVYVEPEFMEVDGAKYLSCPGYWREPSGRAKEYIHGLLPRFTTDPSFDYKVLEWVRENLTTSDGDDTLYNAWVAELSFLFSKRASIQQPTVFSVHNFLRWYRDGDYSRALLELDRKGLLK